MEHQNKIKKLFRIKHEEGIGYKVFFCVECFVVTRTKEEARRIISDWLAIPHLVENKIKDLIDEIDAVIYMERSNIMIDEDIRICFMCGARWSDRYNGTKHKQTEGHRHNTEILMKIEEMVKTPNHDKIEVLYLWQDIRGRNRFKSRV